MIDTPANVFVDYDNQINRYGYFDHYSDPPCPKEERIHVVEYSSTDSNELVPPETPPSLEGSELLEEFGEREKPNEQPSALSTSEHDFPLQQPFNESPVRSMEQTEAESTMLEEVKADSDNEGMTNESSFATPTIVALPKVKEKKSTNPITSKDKPPSSPPKALLREAEDTIDTPVAPKIGPDDIEDDDFGDFHASTTEQEHIEQNHFLDPFASVEMLTPMPMHTPDIPAQEEADTFPFNVNISHTEQTSGSGIEDKATDDSFGSFQSINNEGQDEEFSDFNVVDLASPPQIERKEGDVSFVDQEMPDTPPPPPNETIPDTVISENAIELNADININDQSTGPKTNLLHSSMNPESSSDDEGQLSRQHSSVDQLESGSSTHAPIEMHACDGSHENLTITPTTSHQSQQNSDQSLSMANIGSGSIGAKYDDNESEAENNDNDFGDFHVPADPVNKKNGIVDPFEDAGVVLQLPTESEVENHDNDFGDFHVSADHANEENEMVDPFQGAGLVPQIPTQICSTSVSPSEVGDAKAPNPMSPETQLTSPVQQKHKETISDNILPITLSNTSHSTPKMTPVSSHQSFLDNVHVNDKNVIQGDTASGNEGVNCEFDDDDDDGFGDFHDSTGHANMADFQEPGYYSDPFSSVNVLNPMPMVEAPVPQLSKTLSHMSEPNPSASFSNLNGTSELAYSQTMNTPNMADRYNSSNALQGQEETLQTQVQSQDIDPFAVISEYPLTSFSQQSIASGTNITLDQDTNVTLNVSCNSEPNASYQFTPSTAKIEPCVAIDDDDFGDFCDAGAQSTLGGATSNGVMKTPSGNAISDAFSVFD